MTKEIRIPEIIITVQTDLKNQKSLKEFLKTLMIKKGMNPNKKFIIKLDVKSGEYVIIQ